MAHRSPRPMSLVLLLALGGCDAGCGNAVISELRSPDGQHVAAIFQRDCGATTGYSTQVSVLRAGERLDRAGNVFRADTDHGRAPAAPHGGPAVEVRWRGANTLEVRRDRRARVFAAETRRGVVRVVYADLAP